MTPSKILETLRNPEIKQHKFNYLLVKLLKDQERRIKQLEDDCEPPSAEDAELDMR